MGGADPNSQCVRLLDVQYLDGGVVFDLWSKDESDGYVGRGFRFGDQWWIEPGTIVILETDGGTGPVEPLVDFGLELAPWVQNGQMVGIVTSEDGFTLEQLETIAQTVRVRSSTLEHSDFLSAV